MVRKILITAALVIVAFVVFYVVWILFATATAPRDRDESAFEAHATIASI